ncbi:MAG TPA: hypothetical protein VN436_02035 [Holophaga sp.]|nr:hypothetical protein [Holophaga sp.]
MSSRIRISDRPARRAAPPFEARIEQARAALHQASHIVVGGGAGLSDAAGLTYSGERFTGPFARFIERYGMADMYSAGFHPFRTEEERWAYWALHVSLNRYDPPGLPLYRQLLSLLQGSPCFVITTNVDHQFAKAGFPEERIFAVQGDYGLLQCAKACHRTLYGNETLVRTLLEHTVDCRVPGELVPRCPRCGGPMDVNLRKGACFVEDEAWEAARGHHAAFLAEALAGRAVFLELGVGFNTPAIIRFPFEQMVFRQPEARLIRLNRHHPLGPEENAGKTIAFAEDMGQVLFSLIGSQEAGGDPHVLA